MLVFVIASTSVPERLALPASNAAVGSVFNLDFPILYVLHGNKELILFVFVIVSSLLLHPLQMTPLLTYHGLVLVQCIKDCLPLVRLNTDMHL